MRSSLQAALRAAVPDVSPASLHPEKSSSSALDSVILVDPSVGTCGVLSVTFPSGREDGEGSPSLLLTGGISVCLTGVVGAGGCTSLEGLPLGRR